MALHSRLLLIASLLAIGPAAAALPDPVRFGAAIEVGDLSAARRWLDEGLDPNFMADRIGTGLMIGAWEGSVPMMELFLAAGADVNRANRAGEQALQLAALRGHVHAVVWLLERGAALDRPGKQWSALHYAVFGGHAGIAKLLLAHGARLDARSPNDSTPLMLAAREGNEGLARMLVDAGADTRPTNDWGDSAQSFALRYGHRQIARVVAPPLQAVEAPPPPAPLLEAPTRSLPPPARLAELLRKLREAEAAGQPTAELRRSLFEAVAEFRRESEPLALPGRRVPRALIITARRGGGEHVELVYERSAPLPADVAGILARLREAQAQGRPTEDLRRALREAVQRFKRGPEAP